MTVFLHWPSFGPYHHARLRAVQTMAPREVQVVGLAAAGQVQDRPWLPGGDNAGASLLVAFPDRIYHEIPNRLLADGIWRRLEELQPVAVGISGYGMADSRAALKWCRQRKAAPILMTESKADDAPRSFFKEFIKRCLVARYRAAVCGGAPHREYLLRLGMPADRIWDKYDVVDNEHYAASARAARSDPQAVRHLPGLQRQAPYFLAASRMIPRKNLDRLVRAFAAYKKRQDGTWNLVILGTGEGEGALRGLVQHLNVSGVTFAGFRQGSELAAYYAFAGAFIHPALQEQWGLVVNEAMACGLPVLVSRTVGCAQDLVVDGANGYKFDPRDEGDMASAMSRLANGGASCERMGQHSLAIIQEWTPAHFARNFWAAVDKGRG